MSCEICGKGNCTASFHSIEEQQSFGEVADAVKDRAKSILSARVGQLDGEYIDDDIYYVPLDDVLKVIDDY